MAKGKQLSQPSPGKHFVMFLLLLVDHGCMQMDIGI